jgi:hypothetical protein
MIDVLQFVFSSFWVWLGTIILLSLIANCIVAVGALLLRRGK